MPSPSDILSDPDIAQAYEDVRSDKSETTWLVLKYVSATKDELKLDKTGTGGIDEMCEVLGADEAAYAYVRVKLGNDEYSERTKFCFVVWAGPQTKVMRKAKMSFQSGQVKQVIRTYAIEIQTEDKKDLDQEAVTMKLRKAMGANYDRQGSSY
ncbi:actin depolymerizing protein [Polyplosphaeria fusca]|uniref:Actin depolymerizing protein n=1 Tax=Polyplosphaeria fusca TaxID=682080 RepID=A0A9P4RAY8_9PLEO|nr:actin depolymerizing protein [Polyplosphaeria fusca]